MKILIEFVQNWKGWVERERRGRERWWWWWWWLLWVAERVTTSFKVDGVQRGTRRNRTLEGTLELQGKFLCVDPDFFSETKERPGDISTSLYIYLLYQSIYLSVCLSVYLHVSIGLHESVIPYIYFTMYIKRKYSRSKYLQRHVHYYNSIFFIYQYYRTVSFLK